MTRAGGAGDGLVHQRPAEVVRAGAKRELRPRDPELDPGRLHVRDPRVQGEAPDGVH